jgi:hypothetical protein
MKRCRLLAMAFIFSIRGSDARTTAWRKQNSIEPAKAVG